MGWCRCRFNLADRLPMLDCTVWLGVLGDNAEELENSCNIPYAHIFQSYCIFRDDVSVLPMLLTAR